MFVHLMYFKDTGKFYASGSYHTEKEHMFEIFDEVTEMVENSRCPGLIEGHSDFYVSVDVPDHPHNHPHLIIPYSLGEPYSK